MSTPNQQALPPLGLLDVFGGSTPKRTSLPHVWHSPCSRTWNRDSRGSRRQSPSPRTSPTCRLGSLKTQSLSGSPTDFPGWRVLQAATPELTASMEMLPEKPGSKPPLLRKMEDFLAKEMLLLTDSPEGPAIEAQLQVYRQCFSLFMQSFKTYAPILNEIIGCYDALLLDRIQHANNTSSKQSSEWGLEYSRLQLSLRVETLLAENEHLLTALARETEHSVQLTKQLQEVQRRNDFLEVNKKEDYQRIVMLIAAVKDAEERASAANHKLHLLKVEQENQAAASKPTHEEPKAPSPKPRHEQPSQPVPQTEHARLKAEFATARSQVHELEQVNTFLRETVNAQRLDFEEKIMQIRSVILSRKPHTDFEVELLGLCRI
eukprot:GGOE01020004.1.p1 GENE.GGOE01020004.1~~GGOE01020004.1.p1  ORF type:complete len:376 (+),score=100.53 GGOE01020004.1:75-1202(+)